MVSTNILNGTIFETEFAVEALRRGFIPHHPVTPMPWDFIVDCPAGLLKVQVKGTATASDDGTSYKLMSSSGRNNGKQAVGVEVDLLTCWIDVKRVWYIIPTSVQLPKCIRLAANNKRSTSKYEKYRDNWAPFYNH